MIVITAIRRVLGIPVALLVALLAQVVLVNRLPLPGGGAPDLVLLVVAAAGVTAGPMAGTLAGFCGGLALDVAPPGGHLAGEYALVFSLVGYACGRLRALGDAEEDQGPVVSLVVMAVGVAGGEAARAALGRLLSDPQVTTQAIRHVLPGALVYDLLLCPFVLWLVMATVRRRAAERMPDPHQRRVRTAPEYGALRLAAAGAAPRLKLGGGTLAAPSAARRKEPRLKLGGGTLAAPQATRRKEPRLRLAGANSSFSSRTSSGGTLASLPPAARRPVSINFAFGGRDTLTGGSALGPSLFPGSGLRQSGPGKGWLRGSKGSATAPAARNAPAKGWLKSTGTAGLARFSGSALTPRPAVPKFRRQGPARGWLKTGRPAATPKFRSPGRGWLKAGKPASSSWQRKSPGNGWTKSGKGRKRRGGSR